MKRLGLIAVLLLLAVSPSAKSAEWAEIDAQRYAAHVKALTAAPHRLAGTAEAANAADYIERTLRGLSGQVLLQRFTFPQQIVDRCELRLPSGIVPLQPLAANGLQLCATTEEGISGPVINVGKATEAELTGKDLTGSIVVADFDLRDPMPTLFRLGVRAIIFVGVPEADRTCTGDKRTFVSADLPRFYVSAETAQRTGLRAGGAGVLVSRMRWELREGRNIFLWVRGTEPRFARFNQEEFILLSAWYDSMGVVPTNSPASEPAANCAALLETARAIAEAPPRRSMLIAFFDNHANFLDGGRQFYVALRRSLPEGLRDGSLAARLQWVTGEDGERAYLEDKVKFLRRPDLFAPQSAQERAELKRLSTLNERIGGIERRLDAAKKALQEMDAAIAIDLKRQQAKSDKVHLDTTRWMERIDDECLRAEKSFVAVFPKAPKLDTRDLAGKPAERLKVLRAALDKQAEPIRKELRAMDRFSSIRDEAFQDLREEARFQYDDRMIRLMDMRLQIDRMKTEGKDTAAQQAIVTAMVAEQRFWQKTRESIRDRRPPSPEVKPYLDRTVQNLEARIRVRQKELDALEARTRDGIALTDALQRATCVMHLAYRFSAGGDHWLLSPLGGNTFTRNFAAWLTDMGAIKDIREKSGYVWESRQIWESGSGSASVYNPVVTYEESALAEAFEVPAATLITEQDPMPAWGMPDSARTPEQLDAIRRQASRFLPFAARLGDAEWACTLNSLTKERRPYIDQYEWDPDKCKAVGHQIKSFAYGQTAANRPEPGAIVHIMHDPFGGVNPPFGDYYVHADGNACFPLAQVIRRYGACGIEAAQFDADGRIAAITTAAPKRVMGNVSSGWDKASVYMSKQQTGNYALVPMFRGAKGEIVGRSVPFAPPFRAGAFRVLNGLSNSDYARLHFRFDPNCGTGVYYVERPLGMKFLYTDPTNQDEVALYINAGAGKDRDSVLGTGYGPSTRSKEPVDAVRPPLDLRTALALDMFRLNESRLEALRQKNIILNFYEDLHVQAKSLLATVDAARKRLQHGVAEIAARTAGALERRVYVPIMKTTNDMIVAVTVLLILTLPFAFSLQNLLLPTYNVYKKIAGFVGFFIPSFIILYLTHPAFSFAAMPIIIFLAFFIIVMSGVVIYIISGKFFYEVKKLQGLAAAAHTFEKSFFGHLGSAVALAFSTMRRRPVRTALTIVTVLLLTFTILSFAAFQSEKGINEFYRGSIEGDQTSRIMFHRKVWKTMDRDMLADVTSYVGADYRVYGTYWRIYELTTATEVEDLHIPVRKPGGKSIEAAGIMSLNEMEIARIPAVRNLLPGGVSEFLAGKGVYLSEAVAKELAVKPGDMVKIDGLDLAFLGAFKSRDLSAIRHIDGAPFLPINYALTKVAIGKFESKSSAASGNAMEDLENELAQLGAEALEPISADSVIIVPTALAARLGMALKAISVYPLKENQDLAPLGRNLAVLNDDGVYLNRGGEGGFFLYGDKVGVAGAKDIILPLILGGLIVFSTMLGSVIDREKEIYTFSALGLAPRNIAMLFFVEAGIYAVIGGFGGYLLGQVVTRVMEILASYGLFKAPEMNYSSTTAITTILVVMATVVVSTIYPALQAANKATAETSRRWKIPAPKGDALEFDFPFTISQYDITGIICFIREHFANHADRTVGQFAADHAVVGKEPLHGMASLRATIWLQPFDQGISQTFDLSARPSEIPEVCEVHLRIERLSGPPSAWQRSNMVFLEDMRTQFLLWRTLDNDVREHYLGIGEEVERGLGIVQGSGPAVPPATPSGPLTTEGQAVC